MVGSVLRLGEMIIHELNSRVNVLLHFVGEQTTVKYTQVYPRCSYLGTILANVSTALG